MKMPTHKEEGHVEMEAETQPNSGSTEVLGPTRGWKRREEPPQPSDGRAPPTPGPQLPPPD